MNSVLITKYHILQGDKMKKYSFYLGINLWILTFLILFYYILHKDNSDAFTCTADVNFTVLKNNEQLKFDGDYDFILMTDNKATIHINGTFIYNDIKHEVNRTYFLNHKKDKNGVFFTVQITNKQINKFDNTPSDIFETYFIAQNEKTPSYLKISNINSNLYAVEGLRRTFFTCIRT